MTPLKAVTITRLELTAAVLAVRVNNIMKGALEFPAHRTMFWTDSTTVLRYIRNDSARFHTFVANRLSVIHDGLREINGNMLIRILILQTTLREGFKVSAG